MVRACFSALGGVGPSKIDILRLPHAGHTEIERQLARSLARRRTPTSGPSSGCLLRPAWAPERQSAFDRPRLSQDHIEYGAIDGVVLAVNQNGADGLALLPKAIDTAFPLLMPGRIPGKVVVNDGVERACRLMPSESSRSPQGCASQVRRGLRPGLALVGRECSGDDFDCMVLEGDA